MPKSAKKSSNGQTSTSRYFGGASSKSLPDISTKPGMCSVMVPTGLKIGASRGKVGMICKAPSTDTGQEIVELIHRLYPLHVL